MKLSIIVFLIILGNHSILAQLQKPIILYATKIIAEYPGKSITVMDNTAVKYYLGKEVTMNPNEAFIYKSEAIYKIQKDYFMSLYNRLDMKKLNSEIDKILTRLKPIDSDNNMRLDSGIQLIKKS